VISKDDNAASSSPNSEQAPTWQTVLKLQLPLLGQVNATIQLQNDHVNVTVDAQDSTTAALLKSNTNDLANALAASGTTLDRLTVEHDVSA
jgi:flagellar hook-length control protein FliK